ncbi:DUF2291 domain-containing protein [Aureimonas leprariae]|uniref:DUF2291 domain-containing protein n=1 Tax=Plantimonas leprariae TaxID=2615207 RepID=A0A7V7TXR7_9HYPH|nr:DUF2291 domain-containing protein [Aureimonas leprariae]KAB0681385.1 DUF2291 domain-containing protein [Aureimonas leprariae]
MSAAAAPAPKAVVPKRRGSPRRRLFVVLGLAVLVVAAMAVDTTVVRVGSEGDVRSQAFSPDRYGETEFPRIQADIEKRAPDAATLAAAVIADKAAATKQYGTASSTGAILPVKLTGTVGEGKSGIYDLSVEGVPPDVRVRVQTGPAINGTDLRDATGDIAFGKFKNQIEYQNAGAGINRAMKAKVLDGVDVANLKGKTVEVAGAFRLINPKNWLITPVRLTVK